MDTIKAAVENASIPSKEQWKGLAHKQVWIHENKCWLINNKMYSSLSIIREYMTRITVLAWWKYAQLCPSETRKCRIIIRLLLDCSMLKSSQYKYKNISNPYCEFCKVRATENAKHVLFECAIHNDLRHELWQQIQQTFPPAMYKDIMDMNSSEKCTFMLCGLGNTWAQEWKDMYKAVIEFVTKLYFARIKLKDY